MFFVLPSAICDSFQQHAIGEKLTHCFGVPKKTDTMKATSHVPNARAFRSRVLFVIALTFGLSAPLSAQNLFLENRTDCEFKVFIRYADVGCDWSEWPEYTPSNVCGPNQGLNPYPAPPPNTNQLHHAERQRDLWGLHPRYIRQRRPRLWLRAGVLPLGRLPL